MTDFEVDKARTINLIEAVGCCRWLEWKLTTVCGNVLVGAGQEGGMPIT